MDIAFSEMTLARMLLQTAGQFDDKTAFRMKRQNAWYEISYGEAARRSQGFARHLAERGFDRGSRAILFGESCPEWAVAYFGCAAAGMSVIPLDPQTRIDEALAILDFAEAQCFIASDSLAPPLKKSLDKAGCDEPLWTFTTLPEAPGEEIDRGEPDAVASVIFIAGTTIEPRAAMLSHSNLLANVASVSRLLHPFPTDEFLSILPLNTGFEFTNGLLGPITAGASVTYAGTFNPRKILAMLNEVGATVMLGIPRLFQMCADMARRRAAESNESPESELRKLFGDSVRVLVCGGSALDHDVYELFLGADMPIHEGYGLTEASPVLTVNPYRKTKKASVGVAVPEVEIRIDAPGSDGIGEVIARGPNVMQGYLKNPTTSAEKLRGGWLRTGDLGRLDEDRYLYLTGRIKDMIVTSAGKNVYPDEVELIYKNLPYVREMCVIGVKSPQQREEVHGVFSVASVVLRDEEKMAELQAAIQERGASIPSYQRLQRTHFWAEELPKTSSMRLRRDAVREWILEGGGKQAVDTPSAEAAEPIEEGWKRELANEIALISGADADSVQLSDDLDQDLQLDSLMKMEMLAAVEKRFSVSIPEQIALRFQTIQDAVDFLEPYVEEWIPQRGESEYDESASLEAEMRYLDYSSFQKILGRSFRWTMRLIFKTAFRLKAEGTERLPTGAPYIIAANHASHLDSPAALSALGEAASRFHVLGAKDYFFDSYAKGWAVNTLLNVLPFDRRGNFLRSLQLSREALHRGRSLLIFPEGTRSRDGSIQPFKPGLGLLALELGAAIVPAHISGTCRALPVGRRFPALAPVHARFGEPILMSPYQERAASEPNYLLYREIADRVERAVRELGGV